MIMLGQLPLFVWFLVKINHQSLQKSLVQYSLSVHLRHACKFVSFEFEYHFF